MTYYVYLHRRSDSGAIFYVGKGQKRRAWKKSDRNPFWKRVAQKYGYSIHIYRENLSQREALYLERRLVQGLKRFGNLTNLTDGGDGNLGHKHSDESRRSISVSMSGRTLDASHVEKMSEATKMKWLDSAYRDHLTAQKIGKTASNETRQKMRASKIGIVPSKACRDAARKANIGKVIADHVKEAISMATTDHTIRIFRHVDHGLLRCTMKDLRVRFKIDASSLSRVVAGKAKTAKGWAYEGICPSQIERDPVALGLGRSPQEKG